MSGSRESPTASLSRGSAAAARRRGPGRVPGRALVVLVPWPDGRHAREACPVATAPHAIALAVLRSRPSSVKVSPDGQRIGWLGPVQGGR